MFEEFACGCILSRFQGRVRICLTHHNVVEYDGTKWVVRTSGPSGKVVQRYPGNGERLP
jgi:hypothetical protein